MSDELDKLVVNHNSVGQRYEVQLGDDRAMIEYGLIDRSIIFVHTEVPEAFEGRGIGQKLAQTALEDARSRQLMVVPLCPFVAKYIRRHPEYRDLVAPAFLRLVQDDPGA